MASEGKRPAMQWYPGDWRRDTALQSCSFGARGLWFEMLNLMHDGEPYGHLTAGGVPIDARVLARMVGGVSAKQAEGWLLELESRRVFSRRPDGVIYSRRMVRDERLRLVRAEAGKKGGNPALLDKTNRNHRVNHAANQNPTPAVALAVASAKTSFAGMNTDPDFERGWLIYPRRSGDNPKQRASKAWQARRREGVTAEAMLAGVERYRRYCDATGKTGTEFVKQAATFFGPDRAFEELWSVPVDASEEAAEAARSRQDQDRRFIEARLGMTQSTDESPACIAQENDR